MAIENIIVPDIGGAEGVEVIELNVSVGDHVNEDDGIVTLESDKATMEVPAPFAGVIKELKVAVGDQVSEGSLVAVIDTDASASASDNNNADADASSEAAGSAQSSGSAQNNTQETTQESLEITVPDIGGAEGVEVIEIAVKAGDQVEEDQALITLESDKATMDVPAPSAGTIESIAVNVGDKVSEGSLVANLLTSPKQTAAKPAAGKQSAPASAPAAAQAASPSQQPAASNPAIAQLVQAAEASAVDSSIHASPAVRRVASEFGINLKLVKATGPKGRILKEDVQNYVRSVLAGASTGAAAGAGLPEAPKVDFSKFGETETKALTKIKKLTGKFLSRNWLLVPHVTQFNDADITDLEAFRQEEKATAAKQGIKLTPLVFIMKAVVAALKEFPEFNASLSQDGSELILKKYFNIGVAVDTPEGLVVPVIKGVDCKGIFELSKELGEISAKAREGKLLPKDMQGACFTISSLGGIGGTAFTPIVNLPEVAILGVSRSQMKPVYNAESKQFDARLMLPLSLSYDHRVIDGAEGARFIMYLSKNLEDIRQLVL